MATIYHYCSQEAFKSIIESKSLYLCDYRHSNDYLEGLWSNNIASQYLTKFVQEGGSAETANIIYRQITSNLSDKFMCCFSEEKDLLSQWRGYANNGKGIAIGFNTESMGVTRSEPLTSIVTEHSIALSQIEYDIDKQKKTIESLLSQLLNGPDNPDIFLSTKLSQYSTIYKNNAFSEEKEWRLMYTPILILNEQGESMLKNWISQCLFRTTNQGISPYFIWKFPEKSTNLIEEVVLGPQYLGDIANVEFFLKHNGYTATKISRSNASYRC